VAQHPVPAPDHGIGVPHNGSSFLTPGNHERLLQAEARTRTALNNSTKGTKISGFERCKAMMIRRLRMGHTPQEQREKQRQSNLESITLPNERYKDALSSGPDASAPYSVLSDTSPGTKRAEGPPIRKSATEPTVPCTGPHLQCLVQFEHIGSNYRSGMGRQQCFPHHHSPDLEPSPIGCPRPPFPFLYYP
jgi:hypothetical protein